MKAIFVVFNQSLTGHILDILGELSIKGFTQWTDITGNGSAKGVPHEGTHTWPELNNAHLIVIEDDKVKPLLDKLKIINEEVEDQGLRAFVWNIENSI